MMSLDIKKLATELEEEIGEESIISIDTAVEEMTSPDERTIHWKFPITSQDDAIIAMNALKNRSDERVFALALITGSGTDIYFIDNSSVEQWLKEIGSKINGKYIYSCDYDLQMFTEEIVPIQPGNFTVMEELSSRAFSGVSKSMIFLREHHHGSSLSDSQMFLDHLFGMYLVYLRLKHDTKNINIGKFKVPVKI